MKELVTYLPHVYPFSIVEMNEQKLVVLSNDNGRLRLYDPTTSIEYPYRSEPLYMIANSRYCAELALKQRLWLKWGDFSIAPDNCALAQALIKLAWYYVHHNVSPSEFPTMYFSTRDRVMKPMYGDNEMGFMDIGGIRRSELIRHLWMFHTMHYLGTSHEKSLLTWDQFEKEFMESIPLVGGFSLPSYKIGWSQHDSLVFHNGEFVNSHSIPPYKNLIQENSLIFYNGEVGYLTDYSAPPRLIVRQPRNHRSEIPAHPDATAYLLMTPSQCAHAVLHFGLTDL